MTSAIPASGDFDFLSSVKLYALNRHICGRFDPYLVSSSINQSANFFI